MPTYDYKCENCSHLFEYFQAMSDDPLTKCPDCGQDSLRRLIGGGMGIIFKGSGFYVNDAKKSASTSAPLKDKNEAKNQKDDSAAKGSAGADSPAPSSPGSSGNSSPASSTGESKGTA